MYSYDAETGDLKAYSVYWKRKFVGEISLDGKTFKREVKIIPKELLRRINAEMEDIKKDLVEEEKNNG